MTEARGAPNPPYGGCRSLGLGRTTPSWVAKVQSMNSAQHKQALPAALLGCAAAGGYAALKAAWALGSTFGVRDTAVFERFLEQIGGPLVALWATVLLAGLAGAILLSLVQPWGRRVPRRLRAAPAWLGFAVMTTVGLVSLGSTIAQVVAGAPFPMLTPAIYLWTYSCFVVLGLAFAVTAWRTRPSVDPAGSSEVTGVRRTPTSRRGAGRATHPSTGTARPSVDGSVAPDATHPSRAPARGAGDGLVAHSARRRPRVAGTAPEPRRLATTLPEPQEHR